MIYDLPSHNRVSLNISEIPHLKKSQLNDLVTCGFIGGGNSANRSSTLFNRLTFNYLSP